MNEPLPPRSSSQSGVPRVGSLMLRARRAHAALCLWSLLTLVALPLPAVADEHAADAPLAKETSVQPKVNDKYLSPDLDVAEWTKRFETESRELFRSRSQIVAALDLSSGMSIADVGAGTGLFVGPFSRAVGKQGTVYAIDISPKFVAHLKQRAEREGLGPVQVILSEARSAELPEDSVDLAFVCDVYHHFEYPRSMLTSLKRALRPGGALVVIDFERVPGTSRDWVVEHVRAGKEVFIAEIEKAGFELVGEIPVEGLVENYMLRFRAP